ncbi:hypothetical protein QTN47_22615 [Danxiaibacter flavus]|uniref:Lipoprotein n=1 Tax=Danxiaibacter flavus TaxID=3049108 RepID=A0ABV3ZKB2_9BACT|nr:hypothetical protein QNM32_22620 [Chitinophagaceae bacterium DXS]
MKTNYIIWVYVCLASCYTIPKKTASKPFIKNYIQEFRLAKGDSVIDKLSYIDSMQLVEKRFIRSRKVYYILNFYFKNHDADMLAKDSTGSYFGYCGGSLLLIPYDIRNDSAICSIQKNSKMPYGVCDYSKVLDEIIRVGHVKTVYISEEKLAITDSIGRSAIFIR